MLDRVFEFLHAADLHLDTQVSGMHGYPDELAEVFRDASLRAFENLIDEAISRDVAFCVFAGDIYDGAERGTRAELAFRRGLVRLAEAAIPAFVAHGNHDPIEEGWSTVSQWPDTVTVFGSDEPETVTLEIDGTTVAVHGISYPRRDTGDNLALRFGRHPDATVQIGVLHTNVGGNTDHAPYAPCSLQDLRSVGLDYWALGHIHAREVLAGPDPWVVYPGNTQGRHAKPSEQGPKGAMVVEVGDDDSVHEPTFLALDMLRFASIEVAIDRVGDLGELIDELSSAGTELRSQNAGRALVVRATFTGSGPVHGLLAKQRSHRELLESLREESSSLSPVLWWDSLVDRTTGEHDLDELAGADDFTGNVLRWLDALADRSDADADHVHRGVAGAGVADTADADTADADAGDADTADADAGDPDGGDTDSLLTEMGALEGLSPSLSRLGTRTPAANDPELLARARTLAASLLSGGKP